MRLLEILKSRQSRIRKLLAELGSEETAEKRFAHLQALRDELASQQRREREVLHPLAGRSGKLARLLEESSDRESDLGDLFRELELVHARKDVRLEELRGYTAEVIKEVQDHFEEERVILYPEILACVDDREEEDLSRRLEPRADEIKKAA